MGCPCAAAQLAAAQAVAAEPHRPREQRAVRAQGARGSTGGLPTGMACGASRLVIGPACRAPREGDRASARHWPRVARRVAPVRRRCAVTQGGALYKPRAVCWGTWCVVPCSAPDVQSAGGFRSAPAGAPSCCMPIAPPPPRRRADVEWHGAAKGRRRPRARSGCSRRMLGLASERGAVRERVWTVCGLFEQHPRAGGNVRNGIRLVERGEEHVRRAKTGGGHRGRSRHAQQSRAVSGTVRARSR